MDLKFKEIIITKVKADLNPLAQQAAAHGVVPVLAAREAEGVRAAARDGRGLHVRLHLDRVAAVRRRAPAQQPVALHATVSTTLLARTLAMTTRALITVAEYLRRLFV